MAEALRLQFTEASGNPSHASSVPSKVDATICQPIETADSITTHVVIEPEPPIPAHMHLARYPPVPRVEFTGDRYCKSPYDMSKDCEGDFDETLCAPVFRSPLFFFYA
ncbi:hypothetical protein SERLA73DRAFT_78165 [Serpula lacrymans var. lacrymans S7.3]|uniref:Uncharacterized protein n=2 Tax=Serpula lacrymans var. lacrymans TaxID=341189 RepID=F8QD40_SERL3|nr:uncharacterized protein SERLADRAFT_443201 [Serpula lacrymans var. lacrymans S7.9]EGN93786.1 hypothetical protein SERLA73DRAFT_78165 [Serpula lacrymans var. lacrymans S7.3]EGO19158.1 hypothetical protein SERLADRAFT_443201 [Serpula lacrymans var. lacrymans S7.9]